MGQGVWRDERGEERKNMTRHTGRIFLVVLDETSDQIGLVASGRQTTGLKELLELRHLHRIVVGHRDVVSPCFVGWTGWRFGPLAALVGC